MSTEIETRALPPIHDTATVATGGTALAMLLALLLIVVAELTSPINDATDSSSERVAAILDHSGRYALSVLCLLAGMLLLVPAVLGLAQFLPAVGRVGPSLAAAGFMLFAVTSGALGVGPSAWAAVDDGHRDALVAAFDAMDGGNGAMPLIQWGPILALVGLVTCAVALWRHSGYPRWAVTALPLGWAIFLFTPSHATRAAGVLVLLAGFSASAVVVPAIGRRSPRRTSR